MGRVLVVDDDDSFRHLVARILTSWGHDVVGEAGCVEEALRLVTAVEPDTVLADIGLPDGDGFELALRLQDLPRRPRVVLISSDSHAANGPAAERVGARAFFPKDELSSAAFRQVMAEPA